MKRTLLSIIAFFTVFAQSISAQNYVATTAASVDNAQIEAKFYNRTLYYPGNADDNPVNVHVTIRNTSPDTLRFKLADDRMFSMDFKAVNVKNIELEKTEKLRRKRETDQTVYFREIALEPGEEYSFKDYLDIKEASIYYVTVTFYPELYRKKNTTLVSKRLTLEVRPSPLASASRYVPVESGSGVMLQAEEISPDKVVEQTIIARQQSTWDKFFLYMDLEAILKNNPTRSRRYNASSADERSEMLQQFKADLQKSRIDTDIVAIPYTFEIQNTTYSQTQGTVQVLEKFREANYVQLKEYTYYVRQRDGIWQIYKYTVNNLGTEPLE